MDRLKRVLAGGALAMTLGTVVAASGCRSMRNEVPPGPKYPSAGDPSSASLFNSAPRSYNGMGSPYGNPAIPGQPGATGSPAGIGGGAAGSATDGLPPSLGAGGSSLGTPAPSGGLGQPTNNTYGPPGSSGLAGSGR